MQTIGSINLDAIEGFLEANFQHVDKDFVTVAGGISGRD
jgi:hypothetical protein